MNIRDLIKTQSNSMITSDYDFDLPLDFNKHHCSEASTSKRNGAGYSAKPYFYCGEVNKDFYSYHIPLTLDFRDEP